MGPAGQAPKRCAGAAPAFLRVAGGLAAFAAIVIAVHASEPGPSGNPDPDARADALVRAMTLDEKIHLLHGTLGFAYEGRPAPDGARGGAGFVPPLPRLGIPALQLNDGPLGVRNIDGGAEGRATAFPSSQALAASFDPELAYESGRIMGREARDRGFNVLLAGGANIERDAWNGRNFEYLGEDPILAGRLVTAQLRGIQSEGVVSTVKHLVANTQETDRHWVDMSVDERSLREIDLLPFEIAVKESGVGSVMCAYNKVNGIYACENAHLLNDILKSEWGFKGWVMSDWGATHSTARAANAGLDQEFWEERYFSGALKSAVEKGEVSEKRIDDMARRILRSLAAIGALDRDETVQPVDAAAGLAVAQRVAESGIVLLENRDGLLPLRAEGLKKIAVIGRRADIGVLSGGGSSRVDAIGGVTLDDTPPGTPAELAMFASTRLASFVAVEGDRGDGAIGERRVRVRRECGRRGRPRRLGGRGDRLRVAGARGRQGPADPVAAGRPGRPHPQGGARQSADRRRSPDRRLGADAVGAAGGCTARGLVSRQSRRGSDREHPVRPRQPVRPAPDQLPARRGGPAAPSSARAAGGPDEAGRCAFASAGCHAERRPGGGLSVVRRAEEIAGVRIRLRACPTRRSPTPTWP